jgi:hypothetical protein
MSAFLWFCAYGFPGCIIIGIVIATALSIRDTLRLNSGGTPKPPRTLRRALRQLTNDAVNPGTYSGWVTPEEIAALMEDGWSPSHCDQAAAVSAAEARWFPASHPSKQLAFIVWTTPGRTLPPPHPQSLRSWVLSWWRMLL